jgi:hypothetical protein
VEQLWECFDLGLVHRKEASARQLVDDVAAHRGRPACCGSERLYDSAFSNPAACREVVECTRLLGSLERVAVERGWSRRAAARSRGRRQGAQRATALARAAALPTPLYTAADSVVPAAVVEEASVVSKP